MRSVTLRATLSVTGVAHHMMYRSDDRSWDSRCGCADSAKAIGATAISMVIRSDSMCRNIVSISKRGCSLIHAPVSSAVTMLSRPRMWDGGVITCMRSVVGQLQRLAPVAYRDGQRGVGVPDRLGQAGGPGAEHEHRIGFRRGRIDRADRRGDRLVQMKHRHQLGQHRMIPDCVRRRGQRQRMADLGLLP